MWKTEVDDREIFFPNRSGGIGEDWARQVVIKDIVERLEAEGINVIRRKGVIIALFDEN
jgi:hypothetical protein